MEYVCNDCSFYSEVSNFTDGFNKSCNINDSGVVGNHMISHWELSKGNNNTMEHSCCACNNNTEKKTQNIDTNQSYDVSADLSNLDINKK
uniref:Uncharacterized protein n=1 Tax=Strongyloides stercoralis TaxID=6248 RepID=A0A0K0DZL1_STRER